MAERSKTYALLVGIERYDASTRWSLDGPASDVRRMADWLLQNDVPREIRVLLSTLDRNAAVRDEIKALLGVEPGGTRLEDVRRELIALRHDVSADLFVFYWGGHGWSTTRGERCLFCA